MLYSNCCAPRVHNETPLRESARLARATAEGLVCPLDPSPSAPGARSPARQAALLRLGLLAAAAAAGPQRGRSRQAARALHQDRLECVAFASALRDRECVRCVGATSGPS